MRDYRDKNLSAKERATLLLNQMTTTEKMAQLQSFMPMLECQTAEGFDISDLKLAAKHGIGSVSGLRMRMLDTLETCANVVNQIQNLVMEQSRFSIPAIIHMEGISGAMLQDSTSFPVGIARGSSWNPELEERIGEIVGRQERSVGITHTLAPVLDINRDPRMGRIGETYGEDASLAAALGTAYTKGIQNHSTAGRYSESIAKHFLGFHVSHGGVHGADSDISERALIEIYGKPFQAAITIAKLRGIMPCYNAINGEPMSSNYKYLTKLLREKMGFDGVVAADYSGVKHLHTVQKTAETFEKAGYMAMQAGMDLELPTKVGFNDELVEKFDNGIYEIEILNQAVLRVLTAKFRMGLFENPYALMDEALKKIFHQADDHKVTFESARQSLILLKNDGILPLSSEIKKIAVIGPHAKTARYLFGGYTHFAMAEGTLAARGTTAGVDDATLNTDVDTWLGTKVEIDSDEKFENLLKKQKSGILTLLDELKLRYPNALIEYSFGYPVAGTDKSGYQEALDVASTADVVILTLGDKYGNGSISTVGEGIDSTDINLTECQEEFISKVVQLNKPVVGIHFGSRPISSDAADQHLNAIVEAWAPAEYGAKAIVDVLSGVYNPSGKLPVSIAYNAGQIPVFYNHLNGSQTHQARSIGFPDYINTPHHPRYPFGFGLSFTKFEYRDLELSASEIASDEILTFSFKIKNTGDREGVEIAQIYLSDCFAEVVRPVMELIGFKRIELAKGEEKKVTFNLNPTITAFLDKQMRWKIEAGDFEIKIGSSSDNIRLKKTFKINNDRFIEGRDRQFYL
ncbi:glycoside hydrolase family 3 N-terminal domain-containing protein [Enterococcus thailandicus]|uniref:glycoside hydrolase family 3 N-terminal domain-containing protein n=1 Tax=Enterococcus thailandicus TaxID=417368 RepID=UPI0022DF1707|nr:glycoside hydrolase family 3 N-terminal domain-containing protein [Enterococcus thailandicus]